ncbi:hypothetical protein DFH29DRAFT_979350 [Suillus ampliporus]|nr:hypothetical protein DFH29DRAFT_979350 [Suillus ampliporus]
MTEGPQYVVKTTVYKFNTQKTWGDDTASLKLVVASWLNETQPTPNPSISLWDKSGCGFYNDATAKLLYKRKGYETMNHNFQVTAHSWPTFMYKDGKYDHEDPTKGLFKSALLLRVGLLSAGKTQPNEEAFHQEPLYKWSRTLGEQCTRSNVAALLGMWSVHPRAIAYSAVQLHFALSSCRSWRTVDDEFDHHQFYVYMINYFETSANIYSQSFH